MHSKYKIISAIFFLILICGPVAKAQSDYQIYVAVNGASDASGSKDQPVNSLEKAIDLAEKASKNQVSKIRIIVKAGTYYITRPLDLTQGKSWTSSIPLSIEADNKDVVIFHGGKTITSAEVMPVSDPGYLSRFQPAVKSKIRQINLKEAGVDPGKLRPVGFGRAFGPAWMEMFVNGKPGQIARWPNYTTVPIDSVISAGSIEANKKVAALKPAEVKKAVEVVKPTEGNKEIVTGKPTDTTKKTATVAVIDSNNRGGIFYYNHPRPARWKEPKKVWLSGFFMWGYADDAVPIESVDTVRRIIKTALPTRYGFGTGKQFRTYYAYNIPEEIDMPGEYYVDADKGMLYFLPPDTLKSVELSVLEAPMLQVEGLSNFTIKNIQFTCSRGMGIYTERTNGLRVDGCKFTNLGMMAIFVGKAMQAIEGEKVSTARVTGDILKYIYDNTTFDSEGGNDNGIVNCEVYQTGAGGIYLSGGNRVKLTASHSFVKNCLVHDFNRIGKTFMPGIYIAGVGNSVSNCEIYNSPSVGILIHGNNQIIEYNNIHHTTMEVDDMGAIYYGRDPSERGNIVRYNYLHNIGGLNKTEGVYHDDGACGMLVMGNVFFKAGTVAGFIGGGQDNTYINNIFINNRYAMHIDRRLTNWAKNVVKPDGLFQKRLEAVNYTKPPYATAYPQLKDYFKEGPATPQMNRVTMNVMVNVEQPIEGDVSALYLRDNNFITIGDPGFKDYANEDFRLKRNSIIYSKVPGFVAPPLSKMGYHKVN